MADVSNKPVEVPCNVDESTIMKTYNAGAFIMEILILFLLMGFRYIETIYRMVIPVEEKEVKGEIILITGSGGEIGQELSIQYAAMGNTIVCVDIDDDANAKTVKMVKSRNGKAFKYTYQVSDRAAVFDMAANIQKDVGEVSILVINSDILTCRPFLTHTGSEIKNFFDRNVCGHMWLLQAFLPSMISRNYGHIMGVSPMGLTSMLTYSATSAIRGIMESIHEELRDNKRKHNVKFTLVMPYMVESATDKKRLIRFPRLVEKLSPKTTAERIIKEMRQNSLEVSIPSSRITITRISKVFPAKIRSLIKDFFFTDFQKSKM